VQLCIVWKALQPLHQISRRLLEVTRVDHEISEEEKGCRLQKWSLAGEGGEECESTAEVLRHDCHGSASQCQQFRITSLSCTGTVEKTPGFLRVTAAQGSKSRTNRVGRKAGIEHPIGFPPPVEIGQNAPPLGWRCTCKRLLQFVRFAT